MSQSEPVRRLVYASRAVGQDFRHDHHDILAVSRRNNGIDGVSGVLWIDADRYLQILEGPTESVASAFDRIARDPRHADVVVLDDRDGVDRQFGDWSMAGLPGDAPADAAVRLKRILDRVDADVARYFERLLSGIGDRKG
ncbi:hypothetical protein GGQ80_001114 [Sphingomonas jinjuensis]|uniref:BLUF domain-containing protein n=1 Tax=Sphingomonas jinjuensis TaxID=535907 RepID=A0A840FAB2_9SPHN|nr:hypothetical protein [Sphingomonas jinjuensis]